MKIPLFIVMLAVSTTQVTANALGETPASGSSRQTAQPDSPGDFVKKVSAGGAMEVEIAKIAAKQATNADVKAFANRMITDHGQANIALASLASRKGWTVTTAPEEQKAELDKLTPLTGAAFDRAYMDLMVTKHTKTVTSFEDQIQSGSDADLKAWASKTLPTVKAHLEHARDVRSKLGS